jgi:hypothetical protein
MNCSDIRNHPKQNGDTKNKQTKKHSCTIHIKDTRENFQHGDTQNRAVLYRTYQNTTQVGAKIHLGSTKNTGVPYE